MRTTAQKTRRRKGRLRRKGKDEPARKHRDVALFTARELERLGRRHGGAVHVTVCKIKTRRTIPTTNTDEPGLLFERPGGGGGGKEGRGAEEIAVPKESSPY